MSKEHPAPAWLIQQSTNKATKAACLGNIENKAAPIGAKILPHWHQQVNVALHTEHDVTNQYHLKGTNLLGDASSQETCHPTSLSGSKFYISVHTPGTQSVLGSLVVSYRPSFQKANEIVSIAYYITTHQC